MTEPVKLLSATGMLGTGFQEESLRIGAVGASMIGCDGGSSDPGPYYLGSGLTQAGDPAIERDVALMLEVALARRIPLIIGSAGTAGGRPHVERVARIVRDVAATRDWHFRLATIQSELDLRYLNDALVDGRIKPLGEEPVLTSESLLGSVRVVGMMGVEPIQAALSAGADVVIAGRASDISIFAALPLMRGIPAGVAYHAGKLLECGASSSAKRLYPDGIACVLEDDGFTVEPPNPGMRCTPQSVAGHSLYENADPFRLLEPGGALDTADCTYEQVSERAVRVRGSRFEVAERYTVKLEGARFVGHRAAAIGGIRDPLVLRQLTEFVDTARSVVAAKVETSIADARERYSLQFRTYGLDGTLGQIEPDHRVGHEAALLIDVVAETRELARSIIAIAWHTTLHHPIPEYSGSVSNLAFPFSPPSLDGGEVFEFSVNHILEVDDPLSIFPVALESV